jgi:hypothetical protein
MMKGVAKMEEIEDLEQPGEWGEPARAIEREMPQVIVGKQLALPFLNTTCCRKKSFRSQISQLFRPTSAHLPPSFQFPVKISPNQSMWMSKRVPHPLPVATKTPHSSTTRSTPFTTIRRLKAILSWSLRNHKCTQRSVPSKTTSQFFRITLWSRDPVRVGKVRRACSRVKDARK